MKHIRIFEEFEDQDLSPIAREIFDIWTYVPLSQYSDEYRLRGTGENLEKAKELAKRIRFSSDYFTRFKFAREGDDQMDDEEMAAMVNVQPEFVNGLNEIGYVLVNGDGKVLAPKQS